VDVDEDEVEEGEILTCPECEAELEVVQTHPVRVNAISEDDEDEDSENGEDAENDADDEDDDLDEEEDDTE
jgi:alpha-aminoadipate carrier protein LysW